jgi:predicted dehydrogenase
MRIGLVGLGNAGYTLHLPALAALPWATVVGACDLDPSRRDRAASKFSVPVFGDFDEMLRASSPDVVIVGTPPDTHADYCLRALAAGAHVLCEKPFVSSLEEADRVLRAAGQAGRQIALNHEFREMPIFRAVRDEVARIGRGKLAFVQIWQTMDLPPWAEPGWRGQMLQRTLHEAGIHLVDLVIALFGEQPVSVQASISTGGLRPEETDAVAVATLEFSRGRLAQIVQNRLCKGECQYFEVRADTTEASVRASFGGRARLTAGLYRSVRPHVRFEYGPAGLAWTEQGNGRRILARNPNNPGVAATRNLLEKSLLAFKTGDAPPVSGADARRLLEVVAAAYRSAADGQRVALDGSEADSLRAMTL